MGNTCCTSVPDVICSVCLEADPETTTDCGHSFHRPCLYIWLAHQPSCPVCRKEVKYTFSETERRGEGRKAVRQAKTTRAKGPLSCSHASALLAAIPSTPPAAPVPP
jgi:hypothetical protein